MRAAGYFVAGGVFLLLGCGAAVPPVQASGPFDPVRDRERVVHCISAHLGLAPLGAEVLKMPEARWTNADRDAQPRFERLKPYAAAVERHAGMRRGGLFAEAGAESARLERSLAMKALVPGARERLFQEAVERSVACDAMVRSWEGAKGEGTDVTGTPSSL